MFGGTESPLMRQAYRYWEEKRRGRLAPSRADIDPVEMKDFLAHVVLIDVERSPRRYRFRLMGTAFAEQYGEEVTGRYLDELDFGDAMKGVLAVYDRVVATCEPGYTKATSYKKVDGRIIRFERIALPLSDDGENVNMVMSCVVALNIRGEQT
jgi:hypothetical protein